jgi:aspartokinase
MKEEDGVEANTDEGEIRSIIDKVDATATPNIKSIKRLGTKETHKNRPILVVVSSMEVRNRIVDAARNSNSRTTGNVRIKRDAHPAVRVEWKRLFSVKEAEESKPENADRNITIDMRKRQVLCDGQVIDSWCNQLF